LFFILPAVSEQKTKANKIRELLMIGLTLILFLFYFAYLFKPQLLEWAILSHNIWLRCLGVCLAFINIGLFAWVHHALGGNFSHTVGSTIHHELVSTGPYRWVRHPMYSVLLISFISFALMFPNAVFWGGVVFFSIMIMLRIKKEEAYLLQKFGQKYLTYMNKTRRLIPFIF